MNMTQYISFTCVSVYRKAEIQQQYFFLKTYSKLSKIVFYGKQPYLSKPRSFPKQLFKGYCSF